MNIMNFSEANCQQCYKCVKICKVKAIKIENDQAHIISEKCIACGQCFAGCPQNARNIHSDLEIVKQMITSGKKVSVSIAPSFRGFYDESDKLITAMRKLGFNIIEETAAGADITSALYRKYLLESKSSTFITTCCPSAVILIERYYPELIDMLMPFDSPMIAHAKSLKENAPENPVVFLGPCIAKKSESISIKNEGIIDAVLTFDEISSWLTKENINYLNEEVGEVDKYGSSLGKTYPVSGGILEGLKDCLEDKKLTHLKVDGVDECKEVFSEILEGNLTNVCVEVSACKKSCLGGPSGSTIASSVFSRIQRLKRYLAFDRNPNPNSSECQNIDFTTSFKNIKIKHPFPNSEEMKDILLSLDKKIPEDELNCGGCGYDTCREKAISIYRGMSHRDMCIHYVKGCNERITNEIFDNSPNAILILNNKNEVMEVNMAFCRFFGITPSELSNTKLNSHDFLMPIFSLIKNGERTLWENISFLEGSLHMKISIIPMYSGQNTLLILTDTTSDELRKKEIRELRKKTLSITQNVIEKQMRVAQEIASLLGETTAETKVALTKVKDVFIEEGEA